MKQVSKILGIVIASIMLFTSCGGGMDFNTMELKIKQNMPNSNGLFAVAFIDLQTGDEIMINALESMHAASTMKTPVMIEVYKQAEAGKFDLEDSIIVRNEFKSIVDSSLYSMDLEEDSGDSLYHYIGKKRTIYQLLYEMITVSSNLATNILIDLVGANNVMTTMKELGANDIQVLRGVEDIKAYRKGLSNTTTAYDLAIIYKAIAEDKVVSSHACEDMLQILLDQKHRDIIPAKLPDDVKVAHKTGWITGTRHDSGIVYLPDGRMYILVLMSNKVKDDSEGKAWQQNVSKQIYDYMKG
jgi:beta-lactamase class A